MPKKKQHVKLWNKYKRKKWLLTDLLEHLAERIEELEQNQCVPSAACVFLLEEDMYEKGLEVADKIAIEMALEEK